MRHIVRLETQVGLRDQDYSIMHLPSYCSKRKLYEQFCYVSGWEVKAASDGLIHSLNNFKVEQMMTRIRMMNETCHYGQVDPKAYLFVVGIFLQIWEDLPSQFEDLTTIA